MKTLTLLLIPLLCRAADLNPAAERAWQAYIAERELHVSQQHARAETYLATLNCDAQKRSSVETQLLSGYVLITDVTAGPIACNGALLHHWRAAAFVPNATALGMYRLLSAYDRYPSYYAPAIWSCRVLSKSGGATTIAMRMKEQKIITVVFYSEYRVELKQEGEERGYEISRSTHIWQVDNPDAANERRRAERDGDGLLWHLNSYWSFAQWRNGLLIECESVSLTRNVPAGFGWLIAPLISEVPRESLEFTIKATEKALKSQITEAAQ
jgi:hypothetical protein